MLFVQIYVNLKMVTYKMGNKRMGNKRMGNKKMGNKYFEIVFELLLLVTL